MLTVDKALWFSWFPYIDSDNPSGSPEVRTIIIPILQMRKLRHREVKEMAQGFGDGAARVHTRVTTLCPCLYPHSMGWKEQG